MPTEDTGHGRVRPGRAAFLSTNALLGERGGNLPQGLSGRPKVDHQRHGPLFGRVGHEGFAVTCQIITARFLLQWPAWKPSGLQHP